MELVLDERHDLSGAGRQVVFGQPDPLIRSQVSGYCGYLERGVGPTSRLEIPSADVGLIVGFGPPVEITHSSQDGRSSVRATSFVSGLHDSHAIATSAGWQHGIQINLTPIGARMILGMPMNVIANRVVELEDLLGRQAARLEDRLREIPTWDARFRLISALLKRRLSAADDVPPALAWAWRRLRETSGRVRISLLADELGMSRQRLLTGFRAEIGLAPKTVARIVRFQHAIRLIERDDRLDFSAIALECGYYDQAHFNRDFHALSGTVPTDYLAHRLPLGAGVLCVG